MNKNKIIKVGNTTYHLEQTSEYCPEHYEVRCGRCYVGDIRFRGGRLTARIVTGPPTSDMVLEELPTDVVYTATSEGYGLPESYLDKAVQAIHLALHGRERQQKDPESQPEHSHTECRSPEGVAVGLLDGMMAMASCLRSSGQIDDPEVQAAVEDFLQNEDIHWLLHSLSRPPTAH